VFEDLSKGVKNEASVIGGTLANAPGAIWDELRKDFTQEDRRDGLIKREAGAFTFAAGAALALQRVPSFAKLGLGALGAYQGLRLVSGFTGIVGDAWNADSEQQRKALVNRATGTFSREAATVLETTPAFLVGGGAGVMAGRRMAALDNMAFRVADRTSWIGPRTEKLPTSLLTKDGGVNMIGLSRELAARHEWAGAEVGRSIRLTDLKAGRPTTGKALEFEAAFPDRMDRVMFHTHPPVVDKHMNLGARPSVKDVIATADTGIVQSGQLTTIYEGIARQKLALGKEAPTTLRAVVLDHNNQVAVHLENVADLATGRWIGSVPRPIDYQQAVKVLSNWNRDWAAISKIRADELAVLEPSAIRMMKLGM
jgi:hypothetical protein